MNIQKASKGKLVTSTGFRNYDACINPYVGCQFGCKYCYVRFFVKDKSFNWGDFVRTKDHIKTKLIDELKNFGQYDRIVIGTMTDPYQPIERKYRLTREVLQKLQTISLNKVGIFTRSPIVLDDLALIATLPKARIHYTITPYEWNVLKLIEPIPIPYKKRFETIKKIKAAGIKTQVNVSPILPILSDDLTEEFAKELAASGCDEFYVDPMQTYKEAFEAIKASLITDPRWKSIEDILLGDYQSWKNKIKDRWLTAWAKYGNPNILATWLDHKQHIAVNMTTGAKLDWKHYGEDSVSNTSTDLPLF